MTLEHVYHFTYPNDGLANFFLISFCVSRKKSAYGETGLKEKHGTILRMSDVDLVCLLLRFIRIFAFLFRLFLLLDYFRRDSDILDEEEQRIELYLSFFISLKIHTTPVRLSEGGGVEVSSASLVEDCCGEREGFSCGYCK